MRFVRNEEEAPLALISFSRPWGINTISLPICAGTVQLRHIAIKYEEKTILCVAKRINYVDLFCGLVQFQSRTYIACPLY